MKNFKLLIEAFVKFFVGLLFVVLLLFLPAGTFNFPNAWIFIALIFVPMIFLGIVLFIKSPELLQKRLNSKEKENTQKSVVFLSSIMFLGMFIVSSLDFRFNLSVVPTWCVILASVILLLSYGMYAEVMRENAFLSRTVEVQENQKVIDSGLYGIVRHPMYTATILLFLSIPVVLGSWYALIFVCGFPVLIVTRIINEEKVLEQGLEGYIEYKQKVRYRLIPLVW